jgi:hypothetical protein
MIEFEEPVDATCDCCGAHNTRVTRFVNEDGNALGVYYAAFSEKHPDQGVVGIVSLGGWGEDGLIPESRAAFAFSLWEDGENFNVRITDAAESSWSDAEILGRKLNRDEALSHPWIDEVFHITDHMTADDPAIREFFGQETAH